MNNIREQVKKYIIKNSTSIIGKSTMTFEEFEHIIDISVSIINARDGGIRGGSFVQAIINNDLESAVGHADPICLKVLKLFVLVKLWCYPKE